MLKKASFVSINIFSSAILFGRSFIFLKILPEKDLGLIMIFQAIIAILGFAQLGLFNGGLRFFSIDTNRHRYKEVNNTIVTYILMVISFLMVACFLAQFFIDFNFKLYLIALIAGGCALLSNWFSNLLISRQKLKEINIINFFSALISAGMVYTVIWFGITGAIISIASTYVVSVLIFSLWQREYFPSKLQISKKDVKMMLSYGFIPYLGGIAYILNNQIDRFFVVEAISLEALGKFYLAFTFITVFNMFPANLNSLLIPKAINNYSSYNLKETIKSGKTYFLILLLYSFLTVIALILFGETVVNLVFPEKVDQLKYLFIMLPGIIAITLSMPLSFILFVTLNLKAILWSQIISLVTYLSILTLLIFSNGFSIENVAYAKSFQGLTVLSALFIGTYFCWNKIKNFKKIALQTSNLQLQ